jgi:hypothetical protein
MFLAVLGALASACQPVPTSESNPAVGESTSTDPGAPGKKLDRIVVSTVTGAIAVYSATGEEVSRVDPPEGHVYRQPTWLDDATVVFSDVSDVGDHALVAIDAEASGVVWRAAMETAPFYFAPSPTGSSYATTSLRNDPRGAGLLAELVDRSGEVILLSDESPFYTSWSPDGKELAIHITGQRLDLQRDSGTETILTDTGLFQTPVWVEAGLVTLRTVSGIQRLAVWNDGSFADLAEVEGPAGFVASDDLIAIQATERPDTGSIAAGLPAQAIPTIPGGKLIVMDPVTGALESVSSGLALVYQWDQQGESLLYATLGEEPATLVWHVWTDGQTVDVGSFTIQPQWFTTLVPFFDQYAQSVQFWSPSGSHLGYPAVVDSAPVVLIDSLEGAEPVIIPDATWSAWAPSR